MRGASITSALEQAVATESQVQRASCVLLASPCSRRTQRLGPLVERVVLLRIEQPTLHLDAAGKFQRSHRGIVALALLLVRDAAVELGEVAQRSDATPLHDVPTVGRDDAVEILPLRLELSVLVVKYLLEVRSEQVSKIRLSVHGLKPPYILNLL
jgi:hypothetical protein